MEEKNNKIWKSYVWHDNDCFFVSTIERNYDCQIGPVPGDETLVWEFDWSNNKRGKLIVQSDSVGIMAHAEICQSLILRGEFIEETGCE